MPSHLRAPLTLVTGSTGAVRRDLPDAEIAEGLVAGEDWAMTEAWFRFAPIVIGMAERVLRSKPDAEDLAQEVFAKLVDQAKTLRTPASLRSFVYSMAVRKLRSQLRYRRVRAWLSFGGSEVLHDTRHTTQDVESRDLLRKVHHLLERLTPRDRLVFILRRVESMTVEEIAATMDISESTAKRSLAHASQRLSRWIEADPALAQALDGKLGEPPG
jgi:RNA polymerase sigma-70 factor, ECF subfamily